MKREFKILGLLTAVLISSSVASTASVQPQTNQLRILNWGDYLDPQLVLRFEKQMKVKIVQDIAQSGAEMLSTIKKEAGGKYDLVVLGSEYVKVMADQDLIAPLERSKLPNFINISKDFLGRSFDPRNTYSVPYLWGAVGILYNSKTVKKPVNSWSAFFDSKGRQGRFVFMNSPRETIGAALKYQGESLNPRNREVLEKATKLLKSAQESPLWAGFASDVELKDLVVKGQADVAMVYSGDGLQAIKENPHLRYVLPKEGTLLFLDTLVVPIRAPNPKLAYTFIDFMLEPKNAAQNSSVLGFPTPNRTALDLIDPKIRGNKNIYPDSAALSKLEFALPVGKMNGAFLNLWNVLKVKKPKP